MRQRWRKLTKSVLNCKIWRNKFLMILTIPRTVLDNYDNFGQILHRHFYICHENASTRLRQEGTELSRRMHSMSRKKYTRQDEHRWVDLRGAVIQEYYNSLHLASRHFLDTTQWMLKKNFIIEVWGYLSVYLAKIRRFSDIDVAF